jgi:hypothetical protein
MPYKVEYPRYENEAVLCCCCACFITVEMLLCYAVAGWKRNENEAAAVHAAVKLLLFTENFAMYDIYVCISVTD